MEPGDVNWERRPISALCELIVDCVNKTAPTVDTVTPYKMIRTTNVRDGRVDTDNVKFVEEDVFRKWTRRGEPRRGDVILTREAPLGEVGLLRNGDRVFLGQRLVMYRIDPDESDRNFILYSLMGRDLQGQIKALGSGATVEHMRVPDCEELSVAAPHVSTQRKIGSILSAYDDLIENSLRRINILEEMARLIYQEWFVKFRFPGHEKVPMVDSELGKIPEGWDVVRSSDAIEINPRIKVPKATEKPHVAMAGLTTDSMVVSVTGTKTGTAGAKFQNDDTLFARITPCLENGKTGFVQCLPTDDVVGLGSTEFIVLRSKSVCPEYVYCLARHERFRQNAAKSMSGASGRQRVDPACFDKYLLAKPDDGTLERFSTTAGPMFSEIQSLCERNAVLLTTRDLLLPKLISGEIDVSGLDIKVEEEACPA